jgi:hypothetical protein
VNVGTNVGVGVTVAVVVCVNAGVRLGDEISAQAQSWIFLTLKPNTVLSPREYSYKVIQAIDLGECGNRSPRAPPQVQGIRNVFGMKAGARPEPGFVRTARIEERPEPAGALSGQASDPYGRKGTTGTGLRRVRASELYRSLTRKDR